ncbi:MAG: aminoglycoside phosphotransferase family protein [Bacteroidetes bacterium]|nr:aminoglycoside phosphotransferase family protein [Bacteroidota bacterium]
MIEKVLAEYGINSKDCDIQPFGSGLINHTWDVKKQGLHFILQRINHKIFRQPEYIAANISMVAQYLRKHFPAYLFVPPVTTTSGKDMVFAFNEGYYRLFPFVENSHTIDVVTIPGQAFEAAKAFGSFTKQLSGFDAAQLKVTLPDFHNLSLRYRQFEEAMQDGDPERIKASAALCDQLKKHRGIADTFEILKSNPAFKKRVTHHDTKISNVLFDENSKGLCVIDLDTIMPGYFISDVGDMMRTYLSPVNEEETDTSKIRVRMEYLDAIAKGYLSVMGAELSDYEKDHFMYAGKFIIYMQALRFITDHLNNDVYYGARYEGHNYHRAENQLVLLEQLLEAEKHFEL